MNPLFTLAALSALALAALLLSGRKPRRVPARVRSGR